MRPAHEVPTPASCARVRTVAVLGAGIAGLTAAHELVQRGFDVTVYEPRADERVALDAAPGGVAPPIKLGGLAASQYARCNPSLDGSAGRLRPFPGRRGRPRPPRGVVAGEHGFRFFPAYYLHIWDMLQRIPVYEAVDRSPDGAVSWRPTARTVMDNVRRVVTQATTVAGKPSLIFPHDSVRSLAELLTLFDQFGDLGFSASDLQTFSGRLLRYLVTSPLRRASELQNLSAYDFFIGRDATAARRYNYTPQFEALIFDMPKVLAAFDSRWGDARTNITTYLQLQMQMDRHDSKVDGVLNAPTTESWFDHWYHHLDALGVRFVRTAVDRIDSPGIVEELPPHLGPRVTVVLTDGTRLAPDYVVSAVDGPTAERITATLRAAGTRGTVAGLDGFATSVPPPRNPLQPAATRPSTRRDPYALERLGRVPWDRFQTLAGIQYYFDTEFQLVHGHVYYTGTEWGISSINQHGLWERRPDLARDGYVAVLSVDIGDFNTPSRHLLDEQGRGKAARDCPADELAAEVWRQIVAELTGAVHNVPEAILPWPVWYTLDRNLVTDDSGRPIRNEAPYLVPIVGDWPNRPGADPWNPHGSSWGTRPTEDRWLDDLHRGAVWQARHGGYQVHHNSLVFAGTWTKTFTRMTTMEAACESARHAVNAILDHYIWAATGGADRRETTSLSWRFPFGFLDQGFSSPVRFPSPAGDYCFVFDIENREPLDTRTLRDVDSDFCEARLPHPLDTTPQDPVPPSLPTIAGGAPMTSPPSDYTGQLLTYLQTWRQSLEQATAAARPWPTPPPPTPQTPGSSALTPPPLPAPPLAPPAWQAPPLGGGLPLPGLVTAPPVPAGPGQPAPPGPPVPPVATPARPPDDNQPALSPTSTPSDGDNGWATAAIGVHRSRAYSLFSAHLATTPSAAVTDRPTRSAYPWTGATGGTRARPSAPGSSLFGRPELDVAVAPLRLARTDPIASDATDVVTLAPGPPPLEVIRPRAITPISLNEPIAWPRPPASTQPDRGRHSDPSARDGARLSPTAEVPRV